MNSKQRQIYLLIFLILFLFVINYSFLDKQLTNFLDNKETIYVERVIDGDTIVVDIYNGTSIRLLGINTPEKGERYSEEAKNFLEKNILNKSIKLVFGKEKYDKYKRVLGYLYLDGQNINLKLVENGFANYYFPSGKDNYYQEFKKAWENCIESDLNLCETSKKDCAKCIKLKEFDDKNQKIIFYNKCGEGCELSNWNIKDEGRKNFVFPNFILEKNKEVIIEVGEGQDNEEVLYWKNQDYVWTKTGDTLFLRDDEGKLVLWAET